MSFVWSRTKGICLAFFILLQPTWVSLQLEHGGLS